MSLKPVEVMSVKNQVTSLTSVELPKCCEIKNDLKFWKEQVEEDMEQKMYPHFNLNCTSFFCIKSTQFSFIVNVHICCALLLYMTYISWFHFWGWKFISISKVIVVNAVKSVIPSFFRLNMKKGVNAFIFNPYHMHVWYNAFELDEEAKCFTNFYKLVTEASVHFICPLNTSDELLSYVKVKKCGIHLLNAEDAEKL